MTPYLRTDLTALPGYAVDPTSAGPGPEVVARLHLNEAASRAAVVAGGRLLHYPQPQPPALVESLAAHVGVEADRVLVGRGGDDVIDMVVRATCRPGAGRVVVSTPTFPMYAAWATIHGCEVVDVPLLEDREAGTFTYDVEGVLAALPGADLVCICTPGNPTGQGIDLDDVRRVARAGLGSTLVLVDEAYLEFSDRPSALTLGLENVVVLRTLSKAHAIAGARVGYALASPELVAGIGRVGAPFPLPTIVADAALAALSPEALAETSRRVATTVAERERLAAGLRDAGAVVYDSLTNFLLVRLPDATGVAARLRARGIAVRDLTAAPRFSDALRITVGAPEHNDAVLAAARG